jgi:predicted negative regulator of RcsB-dependent stress response
MSHYDDEAQVEQLKQWWKENWLALATGLALGLGGIFGWQQWQAHQRNVAGEASQAYQELKKAAESNKVDDAEQAAQKLISGYSGTPYAAEAALRVAQVEVTAGKLDEAVQHLTWVTEHGSDDGLKHIARLRQARVLWQQKKIDDALKLIDVKEAGSFDALYQELRGDLKLAQGDRGAAAEAYRKALAGMADPGSTSSLQQKLDDLADVKVTS